MSVIRNRIKRIAATAAIFLFFSLCISSAAMAGEPMWKKLNEKQLVKLLEGGRAGFVDREQRPGKEMAVAGLIIDSPPDKVWNIVTDFESYPKMINQVTRVKVIEENENFAIVQFYMFLIKLGPIKIQADYVQKWKYDRPNKITIVGIDEKGVKKGKYVESGDPDDATTWDLVPTSDGKRTMVFYTTISDLRASGMVGSYLVDRQPTIQIGFDLANALIQTEAIKSRLDGSK